MLTKIAKGKRLLPVLPKFNKSPEGNIVKKPYPCLNDEAQKKVKTNNNMNQCPTDTINQL